MAIDKSQIKPILEGQTGREVADNVKANFDYTIDKTNEELRTLDALRTNAEGLNVTTSKFLNNADSILNLNVNIKSGKKIIFKAWSPDGFKGGVSGLLYKADEYYKVYPYLDVSQYNTSPETASEYVFDGEKNTKGLSLLTFDVLSKNFKNSGTVFLQIELIDFIENHVEDNKKHIADNKILISNLENQLKLYDSKVSLPNNLFDSPIQDSKQSYSSIIYEEIYLDDSLITNYDSFAIEGFGFLNNRQYKSMLYGYKDGVAKYIDELSSSQNSPSKGLETIFTSSNKGKYICKALINWGKGKEYVSTKLPIHVFKKSELPLESDYNKYRLLKRKFVVWVDDDAYEEYIPNVKAICDARHIKCTFATFQYLSDSRKQLLKQYQSEGYDIVGHSYSHDKYWYPNDPTYDIEKLRKDACQCWQQMLENNFSTEVIIYPGAGGSNEETHLAVSQYFNFGITAGPVKSENWYGKGRYQIGRYFLNSANTIDDFKSYVSSCEKTNTPLILGTHSGSQVWHSDEWNTQFVEQCIDYLLGRGYTFITASQFCKIFKPLYDNYSIYKNMI